MSALQAAVLGAVQGLTEFIPISSSGHLVLVPEALGWDHPSLAFDVLLHAASLVALLVYFRGDLIAMIQGALAGDHTSRRLVALLAVGTIPAAVAGIALGDYFEDAFADARATALQLIATALILVGAELVLLWRERRGRPQARTVEDLGTVDALAMGAAQAAAILPGISRSGATIAVGLGLRMTRDQAARFSFLLAIPALAGAALVELPDLAGGGLGIASGTAGFLVSLTTSYAAIAGLIRYLRTRTLYPFAIYCVVAGVFFYTII